jgi:PncC family amidohydrolase
MVAAPTRETAMQTLLPIAHRLGAALKERKETIAIAEGSAGGLVSAALLAVPGASAYFLGGAVVYTRTARRALLGLADDAFGPVRPASGEYSLLLARAIRDRFGATWAIAESGATGPTGNRYGDAAGHAALAVAGPREASRILETASADREANMRAFARAALELLEQALGG